MSRSPSCPISGRLVDQNACRLSAFLAIVVLVIAYLVPAHWLAGLLALEFGIRLIYGLGRSPLGRLARLISRKLRIEPRMVDAAPKRFAGGIALVLSVSAFVAGTVLGSQTGFAIIAGIFAVCAALEAFLGFCLGCQIYTLLPSGLTGRRESKEVAEHAAM